MIAPPKWVNIHTKKGIVKGVFGWPAIHTRMAWSLCKIQWFACCSYCIFIFLKFEKLSCKTTILRIGLVLSNKGGAFVPLSQPTRWGLGAWFGNGQQWQSWIHIDDLIALIDFCLQNQLEGCINATAPNPVRQRDLIQTMAKELRVPQFLPGIPKFLMSLTLGGMHKLVYDSIYAKPQRLLSCGYPYKFLDITTCVADLIARN